MLFLARNEIDERGPMIGAVKKNEEKTKREKQEGGARAVLAKSHG